MAPSSSRRFATAITWTKEEEDNRTQRRVPLCVLDGLLIRLEELNLRQQTITLDVRRDLERAGIACFGDEPTLAIEEIFSCQERYMRYPERIDTGRPTGDLEDLRRRMAS